jgi:hypothetical protein
MKMKDFKKFIERLKKSSVLWKQMVVLVFGAVWLTLRLAGIVDASQEQGVWAVVITYLDIAIAIVELLYNARSGGNNPDDTEEY